MNTEQQSAVEARPWRSEDGPEPAVTVYRRGAQPLLDVFAEGRWRRCSVLARQNWADGRVAYQVEIQLVRDGVEGMFVRAYWWDAGVMRPVHVPPLR